ncbi:rhodanese-related sulfurtransferase [Paenibacillus shirakamiensis]|uniref:Rhodanese-related sulfurtransferase n=1 Tax=Paenibacillus shirakamiensis TaxID=1265935 RepID=A0ABS4JEJ6_9BACL|nr:rhodanese-like domain-containing protein [Paenibacillus shirakamiensis]MBP2000142.1 rhodanese-related sulfurtransferase [Paenibacillus shirakamiensis]
MSFNHLPSITPEEVADRLNQGQSVVMLDVREADELSEGHIEGAQHIPLGQLVERYKELKAAEEIIVMCRSGNRSGVACELLTEKGFKVLNMSGGLSAWTDESLFNK